MPNLSCDNTEAQRPLLKAGFFSRWFFLWMDRILRRAYRKTIDSRDFYRVCEDDSSSHLCDRLEREWNKEVDNQRMGKDPAYHIALLRCFKWQIVLGAGLTVLKDCTRMAQPFLLARILHYFNTRDIDELGNQISTRDAYLYTFGLAIATIMVPMFHHPMFHIYTMIGIRMRIASSALMYRKVLRLSSMSLFSTTTGHVINLMSKDVAKLEDALLSFNYLWWGPLQAVLILILLWKEVGSTSLVGLALSVLLTAAHLFIGKIINRLGLKAASQSDERIRLMDQIVSGMKVIKMYCWEKSFARLVEIARKQEMSVISTANIIRCISAEFGLYSFSIVATTLCVISYILSYDAMMPLETVLTVKWLLSLVQESLCYNFGDGVSCLGMALATSKRIQEFMLLSEIKRTSNDYASSIDNTSVVLKDFCGTWKKNAQDATLRDINIQVNSTELVAVIGSVGSGKSSLLMAILGELPPTSGTVTTRGRIAYAAQQPWIFSASVKENILFGSTFDQAKYRNVVEACALSKDFELFPYGDETPVGERGVILSGGQRARIGLARAVYRDADIYLLDDPLSAVDAVVAEHLFNCCINGLIKDRVRILVTHQSRFIQSATQIVWLVEGKVKALGNYAELANSGTAVHDLRLNSQWDAHQRFSASPTGFRVSSRSKSVPNLGTFRDGKWTEEDQGQRCSWRSVCHFDVPTANPIADDDVRQDVGFYGVSRVKPMCDKKMLDAPDKDELDGNESAEASLLTRNPENKATQGDNRIAIAPEQVQSGAVSLRWYWKFFRSGGHPLVLIATAILMAAAQTGFIIFDWYATSWAHTEDKYRYSNVSAHHAGHSINNSGVLTASDFSFRGLANATAEFDSFGSKSFGSFYNESDYDSSQRTTKTWIFGALSTAVVAVSFLRAFAWCQVCSRASKKIHGRMFSSLVRASMRFFDTNPAGRILNRFSRDIGTIDDQLSFLYYETLMIALQVIAIILLSAAANPWTLVLLLPLVATLSFLLRVYTPSSRATKRLEGVARSPIFSHLSTTLAGLQSVRAYGEQDALISKFDDCHNSHTEVYFMYIAMSRWLGIRLDWICSFFVSCVMFLFLAARESLNTNPSLFGLTMNNVLHLTAVFQSAIRYLGVMEIYMTSVERCAEYMDLKPEEPSAHSVLPPADWPNRGVIEAQGVSLRYADSEPYILRDLVFRIEAAEKIGICGRTGAGKSSLLAMLFRLCEPTGRVLIDGVCISDIALKNLRSAISIIPQDPVLFSTTVRANIDPFNEHNDSDLWKVLDQVHLASTVRNLDGALDTVVSEGGLNFSTGQRQLVCLARALLRRNKILIIDEATANVDLRTDADVQKTIRKEFRDCTVLTIAHRLDTIMDSDRVMVIENGVICEFDKPHRLLQHPETAFSSLVQHVGRVSEHLLDSGEVVLRDKTEVRSQ